MISKTLSPENQLKVRCPVFPAESKIAACFLIRDLHARGEVPTQRQGCSCAIRAGKCPIDRLIKRMIRDGSDDYHSAEPVLRSFDDELLDATGRVLVSDKMMNQFMLTPQEQKHLVQANENARNFVSRSKSKPRREERAIDFDGQPIEAKKPAPAPTADDAITEAAKSGDLSAAINTEASE